MKLCKDCKHCEDGCFCNAPGNMRIDLVTGYQARKWDRCITQRQFGPIEARVRSFCGLGARWFEPKEPEPK